MEGSDAAAILARRAALIASALSSFALVVRAEAQEPPAIAEGPCASGVEPDEAAKIEAKARLQLAMDFMSKDVFEQASLEARRAYERVPHEKIALVALDADLARGAFVEAYDLAVLHERCFGATSAVSERREKARASTAHVTFRDAIPGATIELDGEELTAEQITFGVRLALGDHKAILRFQASTSEAKFTVVAGEDQTVAMGPLGPPPMPCLQPFHPYEAATQVLRLQGGVMPQLGIHLVEPSEITGGPGLFEEVAWQPIEGLWLEANLFQCVSFNDRVAYGWVGGGVDVQYRITGGLSLGLGFAGGGLITPEDSTRANGFFGPVIIPVSVAEGLFFFEARVPIWLTPVVGFEPKVELGMLAPQLVIGIGGAVIEEGGFDGPY